MLTLKQDAAAPPAGHSLQGLQKWRREGNSRLGPHADAQAELDALRGLRWAGLCSRRLTQTAPSSSHPPAGRSLI